MRYLLIDRVLRLERNKSVLAIKNVTLSEDVKACLHETTAEYRLGDAPR